MQLGAGGVAPLWRVDQTEAVIGAAPLTGPPQTGYGPRCWAA